jgi:hypothetical protein
VGFEEIWMLKSKAKTGKRAGRTSQARSLETEDGNFSEGAAPKRRGLGLSRPLRETRERIEVYDEERSLTRELSDWDSYASDDR